MARPLLSIVRPAGNDGERHRPNPALDSSSEASLIRRVLSFPALPAGVRPETDARLLPLASALLDAHLTRARYFSPDLSDHPVWTMVLFVYVKQARNAAVAITSLAHASLTAPSSVVLRWIAKLLGDGVFELMQNHSAGGEPLVRLSPDAVNNLEEWLRSSEARLAAIR